MKYTAIILTAFLVLSLFQTSCSKTSKKWDKVVFGQIVDSTNNMPINQTTFVLYVHDPGSGWHKKASYEEQSFVTDNNGNFHVSYTTRDGNSLEIDFPENGPNGGAIWKRGINNEKEINTGILYTSRQ